MTPYDNPHILGTKQAFGPPKAPWGGKSRKAAICGTLCMQGILYGLFFVRHMHARVRET